MLVATKLPHGSPGIQCCQTKMLTSTKNGPQIKNYLIPEKTEQNRNSYNVCKNITELTG